MVDLVTKNFDDIVQEQGTAIQASVDPTRDILINFEIGSIWLAACEANAGIALWLEGELLKVLAVTRLATCVGNDVFTFVEDFGMTRLPAVKATGDVTFARYTTTHAAKILLGQNVETGDDHVKFAVVEDTTNPYYDAVNKWYLIPIGVSSAIIKVEAVVAGASGNVASGAISIITTPINYIDTVTNGLAFENGEDQETADQARARFPLYLQSLNKATKWALEAAILAVRENIKYSLTENKQFDTDNTQYGIFYAVIDDGTGDPPQSLLDQVYAALDRDRGFTIMPAVYPPEKILLDITLDALVDLSKYDETVAKTAIEEAVTAYIESRQVGTTLYYNRVICVANDSFEGVQDIKNLLINGSTNDIVANNKQKVVLQSLTVSIIDTPS